MNVKIKCNIPGVRLLVFIVSCLLVVSFFNINTYALSDAEYLAEDSVQDYVVGPGDLLQISVYGEEDLTDLACRVSETGRITFPFLGRVDVAGLTAAEIEERLFDLLDPDYIINPQVQVFIKEFSKFYVYGCVTRAGAYPLYGRITVIEAITMAEGFTEVASKNKVKIIRMEAGERKVFEVDVGKMEKKGYEEKGEIMVQPGDIIIVPESFF